jgi:hypothetical protein
VSALPSFVLCFALTLVCLSGAVASGLRAKRRVHLGCVAGALACLALTIHFALGVGEHYDLASAGWITPVHMWLAKIATAAYLLPLGSGLRTIFHPGTRRLHRKLVFCVLALTVLTAITGTWMLLAAEPRAGG